MEKVFISICIPAYKRVAYLQRLLQSIESQSFRDFEIILSDDSPDQSVNALVALFPQLPIRYYHNPKPLGTPSNWNYAISQAKGEWIKLMHDDDWFSSDKSLELFALNARPEHKFIFSSYRDIYETGAVKSPAFPAAWRSRIIKNPVTLLARNVIGPPSVTMVHSSILEQYDSAMKWRVDIDFYIRILKQLKSYYHIEEKLVNVGISLTQVTHDCINVPEVELPEGLSLLRKYGTVPLRHILVYDAWWRILRNVGIRHPDQLQPFAGQGFWPEVIRSMAVHQRFIPSGLLKLGVISKSAMLISYLLNRKHLKK